MLWLMAGWTVGLLNELISMLIKHHCIDVIQRAQASDPNMHRLNYIRTLHMYPILVVLLSTITIDTH